MLASSGPSSSPSENASSSTRPASPGASSRRIIFKHILPNTVGVIVVSITLLMGAAILTEAALGYPRVRHPAARRVARQHRREYKTAFSTRPWLFVWPGVFIVVIVLCLQFIGDGLRDAFDPRQKRIPKRKDLEGGRASEIERSNRQHADDRP